MILMNERKRKRDKSPIAREKEIFYLMVQRKNGSVCRRESNMLVRILEEF